MDYNRLDKPIIDGTMAVPFNPKKPFAGAQCPKDCKKQTPDYTPQKGSTPQVGFKVKDMVNLDNAVSLVSGTVLNGEYMFDSYDAYDNSCYVIKHGHTWNVLLTDLILI